MFGGKFWEGIAGSTAEKWVDRLLSPALIFWAVGVVAYAASHGWGVIGQFLSGLDDIKAVLLAAGGLVLVTASAKAIEAVQRSALHLLEGYWPHWMAPLNRWLVSRARQRRDELRKEWGGLASRFDRLSNEEKRQYARLDAILTEDYPLPNRFLPTHLGNRLRSAEDYPKRRYELATSVIWPRLWLIMADGARAELTAARDRLNSHVRFIVWSALLLVWLLLSVWWVIPLAILGIAWGYWQAFEEAGDYGDLIRAAVDVHHNELHEKMKRTLDDEDEKARGKALTRFLWRGES
jgi:hypothetical protein